MFETKGLVSVVIPTRNRPAMVVRAIETALIQTWKCLEVIVVIDGADHATLSTLANLADSRVRCISLEQSVGGSEARNVGARSARGEWIAFLDDDDEWFPDKIERQMQTAQVSNSCVKVVTCRLIARRNGQDSIWPRRKPGKHEPISEYLFCRSTPTQGEGFIQTSSLLIDRQFFLAHSFTVGLRMHQDWDWLLRTAPFPNGLIEWVWEPLYIFNLEDGRRSVSRTRSWLDSLNWAAGNPLITPRAFAYFVAIQIAPRYSIFRDLARTPRLVRAMLLYGRFDSKALILAMLFAFAPSGQSTRNVLLLRRPKVVNAS